MRIFPTLLVIILFSCGQKRDLKLQADEIDSTSLDTVYFDEEFSRKINKLDFQTNDLPLLDSVLIYEVTAESKINSMRAITKKIFQQHIDGLPLRLSYPYSKIPFDRKANFYLMEFVDKGYYWFISILEDNESDDGSDIDILYSITFDQQGNFIDGTITSYSFSYADRAVSWTRLSENSGSFILNKREEYFDNNEDEQIEGYYRSIDSVTLRLKITEKGMFTRLRLDSIHKIRYEN